MDETTDKPKAAPSQHIFNNDKLEQTAKLWKAMVSEGKRNEAMPLLEELIVGCQEMLPRLAQYEGFHQTVDVETLTASASSKIEAWLMAWKPDYKNAKGAGAANGLFSFLSKCAKNAFRSELSKVNQYRRYFHASGENLEKFYGEVDYQKYKDEAAQEVRSHLRDLTVRWSAPQEIGCVRFIVESLAEESGPNSPEVKESATETRERIIRSAAYAWCVSPDLAKFFYSWALYAMRDAMHKKVYVPFSEEDVIRHVESYTHLVDLLDIVGWDKFKHIIKTLGGTRIKLPTLQQLGKMHENYRLSVAIQNEGDDPDSVERVGKKFGRSQKTAQQVYMEVSEQLDHKRCGEHLLFGEDEAA